MCVRANKNSSGEKDREYHDTKSSNCPTTKRIKKAIEDSIDYDDE